MAETAEKVILLTGSSKGIGLATAEALQKKAKVIAVSRSLTPELETLLIQNPDSFVHVKGDVTEVGKASIETAIKKFGKLDSVILNAGVLEPIAKIADADINEWRKLFDINFFSVVETVKYAIPHLRKTKGTIVIVSSGAAVRVFPAWAAYCCSKAAINMLVMNLGSEEPDIMSVAVRPGVVDTPMQVSIRNDSNKEAMGGDTHNFFKELKTSGQLVAPQDIAKALSFLALNNNPKLTGQFVEWKSFV
ncbi:NAD(P)-binding protein [Schizosaccharomyces pombe]|uniref:Uncharacterized oxidoreductase C30D10.05c n=1 Tax=Schizosaccharomyces pombe (strain 972 / ATCC 24843) TaxID=284812 RepID=YB45_SCHPO|nr:putative sepiapterin reductase [Schizosaccharomyces pombe]O14351.1 RecName: Full=Uncharacterized oxidoreductase C30D10.05c [Schizosaccharomyces pombe 972h-]CAB10800.1 sepiapterin reductase (predicted) [Schizosaccharomyces pombe]|eukprot:NP_596280.1 putative sepiapterin reductase [Schizosaccharomyces pombe]